MARLRAWWAARSRRGKVLTIAAIVVLLAVGGAAGARRPSPLAGSPGSSTPPASGGIASLGEQIPGLTAADVKLNLEGRGLTCTGPATLTDGISYTCAGTSGDGSTQWQVEMYGSGPTAIRSVVATVLWFGAGSAETATDEFLGYVATLPYEGSTPQDARAWVTANDAGDRVFGGVTYSLTSADTGRARILTMRGNR